MDVKRMEELAYIIGDGFFFDGVYETLRGRDVPGEETKYLTGATEFIGDAVKGYIFVSEAGKPGNIKLGNIFNDEGRTVVSIHDTVLDAMPENKKEDRKTVIKKLLEYQRNLRRIIDKKEVEGEDKKELIELFYKMNKENLKDSSGFFGQP